MSKVLDRMPSARWPSGRYISAFWRGPWGIQAFFELVKLTLITIVTRYRYNPALFTLAQAAEMGGANALRLNESLANHFLS